MNVTKAQFNKIRAEFENQFGPQFEEFFAKHGMKPEFGKGMYGMNFQLNIEANTVSEDGIANSPAAQSWEVYKHLHPKLEGLNVGDTWTVNRGGRKERIEFTGFNPRARKNTMQFKVNGVNYHGPAFNMEHYWSIKQDYVPAGSNG